MRVKVCGMRDSENIKELLEINPDYMGFIFYEKSKRFVGEELDEELLKSFPKRTKKVGVFVNSTPAYILEKVKKYALDFVQLHGEELPDFCRNLQFKGVNIIKAFSVDASFNFSKLHNYKPYCDFFLFDTKGESIGGTGLTFDWSILNKYDNEKPFFLAGGIDLANAHLAMEMPSLRIHALDVNSKFETEPGLKDIEKIQELIKIVKPEEVFTA
ncbi:phosphoribosylanthranilate isomerase [Pseudarcicella hirudinis]|uniref:N-(5'-phosphoribosyl)anthranilate isomerase n=1 Tax=Pseudarcicella hirudinis TaxID=1079859 RepID=A0A1I5Q6T3_9BACT|nr:phosphoribosylanthranilate isomerase [Pseudarcicella hirudinis]SFP41955.1 phosphoribosylanthranilate isomerase [Pseudarcicella hirudinis]